MLTGLSGWKEAMIIDKFSLFFWCYSCLLASGINCWLKGIDSEPRYLG